MSDGIDYPAAVRKAGYPPRYLPALVALVVEQRRRSDYPGFRLALIRAAAAVHVGSLRSTGWESVVRLVEVFEAGGGVDRPRLRRSTAQIVEEALDTIRERGAVASDARQAQTWLLLDMSDDELEGRARLRPAVAERWVEHFPDRPLIEGRLPTARQRERVEEFEDRLEVERLRKTLGLSESSEEGVLEDSSAGAYSQAAAKGRAETEAALASFVGGPVSAAEQAQLNTDRRLHGGQPGAGGWWTPAEPGANRAIQEGDDAASRPAINGL